jgi:sugar phosphate isomerase/epimerase
LRFGIEQMQPAFLFEQARSLWATGLPGDSSKLNVDMAAQVGRLAEGLDLSMCLETGHVLAGYTSGVTLPEALDRTLPRLAEVHLHDAYRRTSPNGAIQFADHLPLGAGDLPLPAFLDRLSQAEFAGPIILELTVEQAQTSLAAIRAVRPGLL